MSQQRHFMAHCQYQWLMIRVVKSKTFIIIFESKCHKKIKFFIVLDIPFTKFYCTLNCIVTPSRGQWWINHMCQWHFWMTHHFLYRSIHFELSCCQLFPFIFTQVTYSLSLLIIPGMFYYLDICYRYGFANISCIIAPMVPLSH